MEESTDPCPASPKVVDDADTVLCARWSFSVSDVPVALHIDMPVHCCCRVFAAPVLRSLAARGVFLECVQHSA